MDLVILDRDGVINRDSREFVRSPDEWRPLPGSLEAIARLTTAGVRVAVATNQSGVARGLFDETVLAAIHEQMKREILSVGGRLDKIVYCPHGPESDCECRKPKPGLFHQLARHYDQDLSAVPCIGDSARDIQAARKAGGRPILVLTGNGRRAQELLADCPPETYDDLAQAVDRLLGEGHP